MCERCREIHKEYANNRADEEVKNKLAKARHKYGTDKTWRFSKIAEVSFLMKNTFVCSECGKGLRYGSLLSHKKCCRGPKETQHWRCYSSYPLKCVSLLNLTIVAVA